MAITNNDVKLLASQRLTDNADGGGRMTGIEIVDGEVNNLFPDISRLDRVYGRVNLRKSFAAVLTSNADTYYGAHAILTDPPEDPRVVATMFSTGSHTDERSAARNFIESYVVRGPVSQMTLLGDQLEGQRTISAFQHLNAPLPEVGEVYCLSTEQSGYSADEQYVRITRVEEEVRTFSQAVGNNIVEFERRVVTLDLSNPLRVRFYGGQPSRAGSSASPTVVRETQVADAARYYGVTELAEPASASQLTLRVASIYSNIVPATQAETPIVDVQAGGNVSTEVVSAGQSFEVVDVADTHEIPVTIQNRQYNYTATLAPIPAPETLVIEYRALGKWYRISDLAGTGALEGEGTGQVNYATGSVIATLSALPDVDSSILMHWGTGVHYTDRAGSATIERPAIHHVLAENGLIPGTLTVGWVSGGEEKAATDDGKGGFTGDGTGRVLYTSRTQAEFYLEPAAGAIPDPNSAILISYDHGAPLIDQLSPSKDGAGNVTLSLSQTPLEPGGVSISWDVTRSREYFANAGRFGYRGVLEEADRENRRITYTASDDGAGALIDMPGSVIDYEAGTVTFKPERVYKYNRYQIGSAWMEESEEDEFSDGSTITARYHLADVAGTTAEETAELPPVELQLAQQVTDVIVPGTLSFTWGGETYIDRQGSIYRDIQPNGSGTYSGTIDYGAKVVRLTDYVPSSSQPTIDTLVTAFGQWHLAEVHARTPGAPLRPGGFQVQATTYLDGDLITGEADFNGNIIGDYMRGHVNVDTGVYRIEFGELVTAAGNEGEPWYDPANVENGQIWRPLEVLPNTVRFNAVIYSTLPLDADLLGLDPVRLPFDGRVPIFRPADVLVVHNTQQTTLPALSAGQTVELPRERLAEVILEDSEGDLVDAELYTTDLAGGSVTMADPLDLSEYTLPLIAHHRIEDMVLCTDAQINGTLTIAEPLEHSYPLQETYVSSALVFGDMAARAHNFFSQQTWSGTWSDQRSGSNTTAQYNTTNYPVEVTNAGAIKERWALIFTSPTTFNVVGESIGQIATGSIANDCAPVNPETEQPYFTILAAGWGSGWVSNNVVRFNTEGAQAPIWLARTTLSGRATEEQDSFSVQVRGDAD